MRPFSWDDLQFFLAVARTGQLSAAARKLRTNHATVSRRIDRLEQALAAKLFERNPRGYVLTAAGEKLVERAEAVEREASSVESEVAGGTTPVSGVVRISTLEGFGNFFLADRLPGLAQSLPGLSIELLIIQQIVSLSRREADMSVTLSTTRTGSHHYEKITLYRLFLYGTRDYLERHPPVRRKADLSGHRIIGYIEDMIFTPGLDYHREILPGARAFYQSSSIHAQLAATRKGLGLCVMPHFMARHYPDLIPVIPKEVHLERYYWCIAHQDMATAPRIRMLTDFIKTEARKAEDDFHGQVLLE
ncbi:LysR family transcriptional regulator [Nitratireductor sp. ZSWI3]|uniref:LysR family transcriptional regulator n=1 Tax=Nitratireductor sp. ZSWI3 TaxID=2966359 RepID=UPI00215053F8|nr:LysR family transcriptional regulator [Nitratireductor sp. ZSWI3]MCR4264561.1 LysR family transcriptional regulator [Nitratireductor sp. ZSWI3]